MAPTLITRGSGRSTERRWAIAAVVLWVAVGLLTAFYFLDGEEPGSASAAGDSGPGSTLTAAAGSTTTTALLTTTTTEPPSTTTTTKAPVTTTTTVPPLLTVAASGDVLGERGPGYFMDDHGGEAVFAQVRPLLESAHLAFVNVEGPISDKGTRATWKEYTFRGRLELAEGLASAGIDIISLANNHSMDYGAKALLDTFPRLRKAGVQWAGAGADAAAASAPALLITPAGIVALLAYTDIIPGGFTATSESPGVNATTPDRKKILKAVAAAAAWADYVIVSFHWGEEYTGTANADQRKLAHQVVDAGADLVLGHHPHVLQGFELYRDRLIAYSLGDFVWDHNRPVTGETVIVRVTVPRTGPPALEAVPVYLDEVTGVPSPVTGDHAASILNRLAAYSAALGMHLTITDDRAVYQPALTTAAEMGAGAAPPSGR